MAVKRDQLRQGGITNKLWFSLTLKLRENLGYYIVVMTKVQRYRNIAGLQKKVRLHPANLERNLEAQQFKYPGDNICDSEISSCGDTEE